VFDTLYRDGDFSKLRIVKDPGRRVSGSAASAAAAAAGVAAFLGN
jgi:hypothetical protein